MREGVEELDQAAPAGDAPEGRGLVRRERPAPPEAHVRRERLGAGLLPGQRSGTTCNTTISSTTRTPAARRILLDDAGDGSKYSAVHAIYHPLLRAAARTAGFWDFMIADAETASVVYAMAKEIDFATSLREGPYRETNVAAAVARCLAATDPSAVCFEDFAPYVPRDGAPIAFMAAPIFDRRNGRRRADRPALGRGDRQGGDRRPAMAPRRLRRHRRGLSRRAGPLPALRRARRSTSSATPISPSCGHRRRRPRRSTPSAATARRSCISGSTTPATRAALAGAEGTGQIIDYRRHARARLMGAARRFPT